MKRIVIELMDNQAVSFDEPLSMLIAVAAKFNIETVRPDVAPGKRTQNKPPPGVTAPGEVMSHFTPEGVFQGSSAVSWVMAKGYARSSGSSSLSLLTNAGFLRNLGSGRYQFIKPWQEGYKLQSLENRIKRA